MTIHPKNNHDYQLRKSSQGHIENHASSNLSKIIPPKSTTDWLIERKGYNREENPYFETLFVLSNGYMGVRNTVTFSDESTNNPTPDKTTKPGIFIAGLYDKAPIVFTELAKVPNWLRWEISTLSKDSKLSYFVIPENDDNSRRDFYQVLDMKKGALYTSCILIAKTEDEENKKLKLETFQFPHSIKKQLYITTISIKPLNFTGRVSMKFFLENTSSNEGLYPWVRVHHFKTLESGLLGKDSEGEPEKRTTSSPGETFPKKEPTQDRGVYLLSKTQATGTILLQCSATIPYDSYNIPNYNFTYKRGSSREKTWEELLLDVREGETYSFYRVVFNKFPINLAQNGLTQNTPIKANKTKGNKITIEKLTDEFSKALSTSIEELVTSHIEKWEKKWVEAWIYLIGDVKSLEAVRFNTFQLLQAYDELSPITSIPAKGLTGEGYRGHIFWDTEIFMLPFYLYTNPMAAKKLLLYRLKRLPQARENAKKGGNNGAQFPWESAESGKEVTPYEIYDFVKEKKYFIYTGKEEIHVTADIAYAATQYFEVTNDTTFLQKIGLPILIESARFWASRVKWSREKKAFVIEKVIGPDEYHEHVDNSFFTNFMSSWNLKQAVRLLKQAGNDLQDNGTIKKPNEEEIRNWENIANNIYLPINSEGIMEEFEGYLDLKNTTIEKWDQNHMPIIPEEIEEEIEKTQLIKQGDVVLLFHLHPDAFKLEDIKKNFLYYEARTTHASSLSPMVYSIAGLKAGVEKAALRNFLRTSRVDLDDNQANIQLGLHLAACGGTWQAVINGFGGTTLSQKGIKINPKLPESWKLLEFRIKWRDNPLKITITKNQIKVRIDGKENSYPINTAKIPIKIGKNTYYLNKEKSILSVTLDEKHNK